MNELKAMMVQVAVSVGMVALIWFILHAQFKSGYARGQYDLLEGQHASQIR